MSVSASVWNSMLGLMMPSHPPATTTIHMKVMTLRILRVGRSRLGAL